jgi:hypothetical protein
LVAFKVELRDFYPRLYAFLIHNHIVHMGTGKYLVADYGDVKAIEEASSVTIWATPKRRTAIPRTPADPAPDFKLNKDQKELYERASAESGDAARCRPRRHHLSVYDYKRSP